MVRDHPAIRQVDIFLKLDRNHLTISLNNDPCKPISGPVSLFVLMVAKDLNPVPYFIILILIWSRRKT